MPHRNQVRITPEVLFLDEPFSGFDPINAQIITEEILSLKAKGSTIIFSTHRMETVEDLCDHIALINKSRKRLRRLRNNDMVPKTLQKKIKRLLPYD